MGEVAVQYVPGQQLAGTVYRVVRHLATGGMGSVYDVEDTTVGKRYVLKTLHPQLISRHDLAKRMEAEARTLAKLQHPNIVDVVTAGLTTDDKPMPFYVMERLNGQNLRVVIEKKGSLEITHCYRIAIDVLDALEHAHENSVIHRDVKPDNIFLHRNANGTTTTKLLDFGIMRLLDRKMSHTQGKFIGTLRYASPEQIYGGELGPATDIYSLGIVLYEMICGRGPFDEIGDAFAIGAAHAQLAPPPVSKFSPSVPPALERLVMSAIAKTPAERPRDCFSFAGELRRMLRQEEAAPKSATAVNVLTSGPPNTAARPPLAGAAPLPLDGAAGAHAPTDLGMQPPSAIPSAGAILPATVRYSPIAPGAHGGQGNVVGDGPGLSPTEMAVAATLASSPGGDVGHAVAAAAAAAVAAADARAARGSSPSSPPGKPVVDRFAETRASAGFGSTQRLSPNDTAVDAGGPLPATDDALRAALAQRAPLEVPPASGQPTDPRQHELVFPATHGYVGGTGPLSGEAQTRPPERSMLLPLLAAAAFGALLVGGALLLVMRPWNKSQPSEAPAAATAPVVTAPALPPSAAAPTSPETLGTASAPAAAASSSSPPAVAPPLRTHAPASAAPRARPAPTAPRSTTRAPSTSGAPAAPAAPRKPSHASPSVPRPEDIPF